MTRGVSALLTLALTALLGCGGSGAELSETATVELHGLVGQIRAAAAAGDRVAADEALGQLQDRVHELESQGDVSDAAASHILEVASRVQAELAAIPPPTTLPPTTAPPPTTPERDDVDEDNEDNEDNEDKDKDNRGKDNEARGDD